ncbi:MAG: BRCT domain-containing protein [Sphaerochaetaceae bacterium]
MEKRGGRTSSAVTGKTTHLLVGRGAGSKLRQAIELQVKIVSEEEFLTLLKEE